jgi:hypothetical protein
MDAGLCCAIKDEKLEAQAVIWYLGMEYSGYPGKQPAIRLKRQEDT